MHKYTEEERQFLVDNAKGILASELTRLFNEKFGTELRPSQIRSIKKRYKIRSGVDTRFKGEPPKTKKEIGAESITTSGQIAVKIKEGMWRYKNRFVWEQHYGEIPKGYVVHMKDGDKANCDIDNLFLIKRKELLLMNNRGFLYKDEEIFKSGLAMVDLIMKIREKEKQRRAKDE